MSSPGSVRCALLALAALGVAACAAPGGTPPGPGGAGAAGERADGGTALPPGGPTPTTTPMVIWFDGYDEVFEGSARGYSILHSAAIDVRSRIRDVRCIGEARVQIMPPDADPPRNCDGVRGEAWLSCSDERRLTATWQSDGVCGSGHGQGEDEDGHAFTMLYGGSAARARETAEEAARASASNPPLPAPGVKLGEGLPGLDGDVSTGTAFFVSWDGHLLTNHHVVAGTERVRVQLEGGELLEAEVVYADEDIDLALLRVEAIRTPLPWQWPADMVKGEPVFTLGYPLVQLQGQEQKATFGRVNALSGLQGDERFAQIDVPIQPGNSGGPLMNTRGEVVGVVTSMLDAMTTVELLQVVPQNVNYAIKSDVVKPVLTSALGSEGPPLEGSGGSPESSAPEARSFSELVALAQDSVALVLAY